MHHISIKLLTGTLVVVASIIGESYWLYTCGPGYDYEKYRISYVDPDLLSDSLYQSFYRTILQDHQAADNYWDNPHGEFQGPDWLGTYRQENIDDWKVYLGSSLSDRSIYDVLFKVDQKTIGEWVELLKNGRSIPVDNLATLNDWEEWDTLQTMQMIEQFNRRKDVPFLRYLYYARQTEQHAWAEQEEDWEEWKKDTETMNQLIDRGIELYREERSEFLKLRYAYQVVRLARYAGRYQDAVTFYDQMVAPNPTQSPIRYRALGQKAGAVRIMGDTATSNFLFAQVFDSSEGSREIALRDFRIADQTAWKEVYSKGQNDHQRANLWFMRGLKEKGLSFDYLREMHRLEPRSPQLSVALLRELHRIESFLYDDLVTRDLKTSQRGAFTYTTYNPTTDRYEEVRTNEEQTWREDYSRHISRGWEWDSLFYFQMPDPDDDRGDERPVRTIISGGAYVSSFRKFVLDLAKEGSVTRPALWYLVAGYIDLMDRDFDIADQCLEEAEKAAGGDYDLRHQIRLLDYLRERMQGKSGNESPTAIAEVLQWMRGQQQTNRHSKYNRTMAELGRQYLAGDDVPRAILAFSRADDDVTQNLLLDIYANDNDLKKLQEIVGEGGKNDLDRHLLDSFSLNVNNLIDLQATRLMRQGEYRQADQLYQSIPTDYWSPSSPASATTCFRFTTNRGVVDTNLPSIAVQGTNATEMEVTRREFAASIVQLLDQIDDSRGRSTDSFNLQIANLFYNAPYWGYSSIVWDGGWLVDFRFFYFGPTAYPFNMPDVAERMEEEQKKFLEQYGSRRTARHYYQAVINRTSDRELAAHAAYMLDLCDKQPQTSFHPRYEIADQPREGYNLLLKKYRDTRYAQAVLSQCSVYRYFPK